MKRGIMVGTLLVVGLFLVSCAAIETIEKSDRIVQLKVPGCE